MTRALMLAFSLCAIALAAPPPAAAQHPLLVQMCSVYADVALVASSLARQDVPREKVDAALPDMYGLADARAAAIARRIVEAGYTERAKADPKGFTRALMDGCVRNRGDLDAVLGVNL